MSANGARGETVLEVDGKPARLCLTLGALAEIETALGCHTMAELQARMRALSAGDLALVLAALLRGAGEAERAATITTLSIAPSRAAKAVAEAFQLGLGA